MIHLKIGPARFHEPAEDPMGREWVGWTPEQTPQEIYERNRACGTSAPARLVSGIQLSPRPSPEPGHLRRRPCRSAPARAGAASRSAAAGCSCLAMTSARSTSASPASGATHWASLPGSTASTGTRQAAASHREAEDHDRRRRRRKRNAGHGHDRAGRTRPAPDSPRRGHRATARSSLKDADDLVGRVDVPSLRVEEEARNRRPREVASRWLGVSCGTPRRGIRFCGYRCPVGGYLGHDVADPDVR